jgi:hypothetical protein
MLFAHSGAGQLVICRVWKGAPDVGASKYVVGPLRSGPISNLPGPEVGKYVLMGLTWGKLLICITRLLP